MSRFSEARSRCHAERNAVRTTRAALREIGAEAMVGPGRRSRKNTIARRTPKNTSNLDRAAPGRHSSYENDCGDAPEYPVIYLQSLQKSNHAKRRRRRTPNSVSKPVPRRIKEAGSGTALTVTL